MYTKTLQHQPKAALRILAGLLFVFIAIAPTLAFANGSLGAAGQSGTVDNPFTIKDAAELKYLAEVVNSGATSVNLTGGSPATIQAGFKDSYIQLSADIDLNGQNWTPIGNPDNFFQGYFDGDGHIIEGLAISIENSTDNVYAGLLGYTRDGSIQNLGVWLAKEGIKVSTTEGAFIGGIAGYTMRTPFSNSYVNTVDGGEINVTCTSCSIGGIVGENSHPITHCYSMVDVNVQGELTSSSIGGITGESSGHISYTYATGKVKVKVKKEGDLYTYVGGICGYTMGRIVSNSLALNKELSVEGSGKNFINRIAGLYSGGSFDNNYASPQMLVNGQRISDGTTDEANGDNIYSDKFKDDLNLDNEWKSAWTWTDGELPQLKKKDSSDPLGGQVAYYTSDYIIPEWMDNIPNAIENKDGNNGLTADKPILINTVNELAYFAQQVNAGGKELNLTKGNSITNASVGFSDYYFALSADIDLDAGNWTPIGNVYTPFRGHFDGKGHTVKGLAIKMHEDGSGGNTYAGLFGFVKGGTLQNIGVELAEAGIEVSNKQGFVSVGGITGAIDTSDGTTILRHCYVTGKGAIKITEAGQIAYAGGITGNAPHLELLGNLTFTHCYATINIEAVATMYSYTGGIAGWSTIEQISYCFATGNVKAEGANNCAGGICGMGDPSNCLALNESIQGQEDNSGRITGSGSSSNNYASNQTKINGIRVSNQSNPSSKDGADTRLETFREDLLKDPVSNNGWEDGKGWKWSTDSPTQLPILTIINADNTYNSWPNTDAQPDIDATDYLNKHFNLHIIQPKNGTLTITYKDGTDSMPLSDGDLVESGSILQLSYIATADGYSLNRYLYGISEGSITTEIGSDTYEMPKQEVWLTASENYTDPTPPTPPTPDPPYVPVYYNVTLPQVEGATTDPEPGEYPVESWYTFRFYLTLDTAYSASVPLVTTSRGETLKPRESDGAYLVKYVRSDVEIFIDSICPNHPVANESIEYAAQRPKAWTAGGLLHMQSPTPSTAFIYTPDGRQQAICPLTPGQTESLRMPAGVYFVRIGKERFKVKL